MLTLMVTNYIHEIGLICEKNLSTAFDIGNLCIHASRDPVFTKIVATKIFFSEILDD